MFPFISDQQRATICRDGKAVLVQVFVMFPALLLASAWVIWWAAGLQGNDQSTGVLDDVFKLFVFVQAYIVMVMAGPVILCHLSDPVETRMAIRTLTASLFSLLPRVALLFETLGGQTATLTVPAALGGVRLAVRPQTPISAPGFFPGASPQLE
ncbi:MAG: hypothetical protein OXC99_02065 [Chloroflexi bacterium]|nr:hypothetical protein [Chloroflexota bacterium]